MNPKEELAHALYVRIYEDVNRKIRGEHSTENIRELVREIERIAPDSIFVFLARALLSASQRCCPTKRKIFAMSEAMTGAMKLLPASHEKGKEAFFRTNNLVNNFFDDYQFALAD